MKVAVVGINDPALDTYLLKRFDIVDYFNVNGRAKMPLDYDFVFVKGVPKLGRSIRSDLKTFIYTKYPKEKIICREQAMLPTLNPETARYTIASMDPIEGTYIHKPDYENLKLLKKPYKQQSFFFSGGTYIGYVGQIPYDKSMLELFRKYYPTIANGYCEMVINDIMKYKGTGKKVIFRHHPGYVKATQRSSFEKGRHFYGEIKKLANEESEWFSIDDTSIPMRQFFKKCELVVGVCSATLTEAYCMNKKVKVLGENLWPSPLSIDSGLSKKEKEEWLAIMARNTYTPEDILNYKLDELLGFK